MQDGLLVYPLGQAELPRTLSEAPEDLEETRSGLPRREYGMAVDLANID